jgi:7-cyano-7-deazaguanine reductase
MTKKHEYKKKIEDMPAAEVKKQQAEVKKMKLPKLEVLDFLYKDGGEVSYETDELTSLCPMTGLPDFYTLDITYVPAKKVPELKSLKLYLVAFRNVPILHEHLACRIYDDLKKAVKPKHLRVELEATPRGGISTVVVKED